MKSGAFSISLSVKDLKTSKEFYEKLGFNAFAGSMEQKIQLKHPQGKKTVSISTDKYEC